MDPRFSHRMARSVRWVTLLAALIPACGRHASPPPDPPAPASLRETVQGPLIGSLRPPGAHAWRGIPFARPPVGKLRWRAPQPAGPWDGTLQALAEPPACAQFASLVGGRDGARAGEPTGQEDCLYLNVFAPAFAPEEVPRGPKRLPVMIWIHGGGNTTGDASLYDGSHLAAQQQVVVVAVQYRLGPFGWFRHPALRRDADPQEASGNFGTLDLIEALRWVQRNAAAFGGDPDRVTIFGESAGGHDVATLLLTPLAEGLFHRAIIESGSATLTSVEAAEAVSAGKDGVGPGSGEVLLRWLEDAGPATSREEALALRESLDLKRIQTLMRGLTTAQVLRAYQPRSGFGMVRMPLVFADGVVLPDEPAQSRFASGRWNQVPVLLGSNRDEMKLFLLGDRRYYRHWLGVLPVLRDEIGLERDSRHRTDLWKLRGVDSLARALRGPGRPPVFTYRFDWDEEPRRLLWDFSKLLGAAHGLEIFFVFGRFDAGHIDRFLFSADTELSRRTLSHAMQSYWARFATSGDPGRGSEGSLPSWPRWPETGDHAPPLLLLDTAAGGGIRVRHGEVTLASILDAVARDARFPDEAARCDFLKEAIEPQGRIDQALLTADRLPEACRTALPEQPSAKSTGQPATPSTHAS